MKRRIVIKEEKEEVVEANQLGKELSLIAYKAKVAGIAKLTYLGRDVYGFVYLKEPHLPPVFVRTEYKECITAALSSREGHEVFSFDYLEEFLDFCSY